jgi:hypothetical protein
VKARVDVYPRLPGPTGSLWLQITEERDTGGIGPGHFSLSDAESGGSHLADLWARLEAQGMTHDGILLNDVPSWLFTRRERQWRHDPQRLRQYRYIADALAALLPDPFGDAATSSRQNVVMGED